MTKNCEVCQIEIPEDSGNLLCSPHYDKLVIDVAAAKEREEKAKTFDEQRQPTDVKFCIQDPLYKENPEAEYPWDTNLTLFLRNSVLLWHDRVAIYNYIKDYCRAWAYGHPQAAKFTWRPSVAEIGCSIGVGANIMSNEAGWVWGCDKNEKAIAFANQAFFRYTNPHWKRNNDAVTHFPQVSFDVVDVVSDEREFGQFDIISCIEFIEHVYDTEKVIQFLKKLCRKNKSGYIQGQAGSGEEWGSVVFITSPNRNAPSIRKDYPDNKLHIREWNIREMLELLGKHWGVVEALDWTGNPLTDESEFTPVLYRCQAPYEN